MDKRLKAGVFFIVILFLFKVSAFNVSTDLSVDARNYATGGFSLPFANQGYSYGDNPAMLGIRGRNSNDLSAHFSATHTSTTASPINPGVEMNETDVGAYFLNRKPQIGGLAIRYKSINYKRSFSAPTEYVYYSEMESDDMAPVAYLDRYIYLGWGIPSPLRPVDNIWSALPDVTSS